ncbi:MULTISPECIES: phosphoribosyl-ATP diphosphatase [Bacillota]|jgi:phosphoribosyl-ATP pyrophosphohydrolase|uniref:Phosphoribosyl-ATP pyrophosphatase n=2 Tax=Amedibacillus TaxID=2749846 RepID=A0A7G9GJE4_9FIRM|nr:MULTISPECIES: phosphoribosyl-ATP diphosphatase [Bacillota]QNM10926.1 phosphoribosyl-ATP diphosphatase [[Eubacterium] hominis]MCH4285362.1 phosphoribosyl-ATP diphosphatase [Amedibacillus hominis]RGB58418.1 phosphoribosyl-ATP diphosphatase [Absiella sp. AM22-9]RGB63306.1 phosphoribosyl-ATP diphosphatase [Absiella sp. AM10-20]RGB67136.1 phosphoribosyl-ATP diphosphatase [Absiella sp. AM09-45]
MKELDVLYETVIDRKANGEEGSYTSYLFNKGLDKILKKVGEECTEVVIASLSQSKEELVGEIGDLMYHLIVLMVEKGITLDDVNAELEKRSQKTHNLKAERKPIEHL